MFPIRTILHPTDFSPPSGYAFELACALARDYGARLVLLHVKPPPQVLFGKAGPVVAEPPDLRSTLQEQLDQLRPAGTASQVERRLLEGDAAAEIVNTAREVGSDLVVMGTHGRTGLRRLLMGSVAEQVVRKAPCPVLTVKLPFPADPHPAGEARSQAGG
jgi:nucleotide-binding universal stress UspA family protein